MASPRIALIAGASGLVGRHCLSYLLQSDRYDQVISVGRSPLSTSHPKLRQVLTDFDQLPEVQDRLRAGDVYCCLGTTIKKAGSKASFYKVDFTYVVELARLVANQGASQFLVVSALGADAKSRIFYNKVKGQMEKAVQQLPFRSVHILQPSVLLGNREESRPMEKLAAAVMGALGFLLLGSFKKYRPVPASKVAQAMLIYASREEPGVHVHRSDKIVQGVK
jgi:uncharacterized protein YbjT (DUF2867 family)